MFKKRVAWMNQLFNKISTQTVKQSFVYCIIKKKLSELNVLKGQFSLQVEKKQTTQSKYLNWPPNFHIICKSYRLIL